LIEAASDQLKDADYVKQHITAITDQLKEATSALPGCSSEYLAGYMLGVQTARLMIASMPAAQQAGIEL